MLVERRLRAESSWRQTLDSPRKRRFDDPQPEANTAPTARDRRRKPSKKATKSGVGIRKARFAQPRPTCWSSSSHGRNKLPGCVKRSATSSKPSPRVPRILRPAATKGRQTKKQDSLSRRYSFETLSEFGMTIQILAPSKAIASPGAGREKAPSLAPSRARSLVALI
jgi:hypothetical protein